MRPDDTQIRVFVSYAQHSDRHSAAVLALAQALRGHGIAVELDRFHGHELIDWPRWCREQLAADRARWVLMTCSAIYCDRLDGRVDPHPGKGVFWEGALLDDELYDGKGNRRIVPVLLHDEPDSAIPTLVRGWTHVRLRGFDLDDPGYEGLYRLLTGQAAIVPAPLGQRISLPARTGSAPAPPAARPQNLPYPSLGTLFKGRAPELAQIRSWTPKRPPPPRTDGSPP
jgi:hypothetical protein